MKKGFIYILLGGMLCLSPLAEACTTWAVAGSSSQGGGTIVAKNRDEVPNHITDIVVIKPKKGYAYVSMNAETNVPECKGGVNEKGFIVLTQSPPTAELEHTRAKLSGHIGNRWLLSQYGSVDEALQALEKGEWSANPEILVLGDAHKVAYVEMGVEGKYAIRTTTDGTLAHANHYLEPELVSLNPAKIGKSTLNRQNKAAAQLASKPNYSFEDIIAFTQDKVVWHNNPKDLNSWRTLASMVVQSTPEGDVHIWVKLDNPGMTPHEAHFTLKEALAGTVELPVK